MGLIYFVRMVDQLKGWFELAQLKEQPKSFVCMKHFNSVWLAHYLRPREIEFDNRR